MRILIQGAIVFTDMPLKLANDDPNESAQAAVVSAAYANSVSGATTTTLYDIDAARDLLVRQAPPNDGLLNTVGALGVDTIESTNDFTGFDISGATGVAYLSRGNGVFGSDVSLTKPLYTVNLNTGFATLLGSLNGVNGTLRDLAVAPVPEPSTLALCGIGLVAGFGLKHNQQRRRREAD